MLTNCYNQIIINKSGPNCFEIVGGPIPPLGGLNISGLGGGNPHPLILDNPAKLKTNSSKGDYKMLT